MYFSLFYMRSVLNIWHTRECKQIPETTVYNSIYLHMFCWPFILLLTRGCECSNFTCYRLFSVCVWYCLSFEDFHHSVYFALSLICWPQVCPLDGTVVTRNVPSPTSPWNSPCDLWSNGCRLALLSPYCSRSGSSPFGDQSDIVPLCVPTLINPSELQ